MTETLAHGSPGDESVVYEWYVRGVELLDAGSAAAAATLMERAAAAEPESRSVREALARAQFDSGRYADAADTFGWIVSVDPVDDYAHFGLGLSSTKVGDFPTAVGHLALAVALRPGLRHYETALRGARAALAATAQ